jgi:hypothetical protein
MQSNKQSNSSFYQNNEEKQNSRPNTISTDDLIKSNKLLIKNRKFETLRKYAFHLVSKDKISFEKYQSTSKRLKIIIDTNWNKYVAFWELINSSINNHSTVSQTEINTLNELIPVTPTTATKTISNDINTLTNQINRLTKLNSYATFLNRNLEKITFYKYRQILLSIRNKIDLKQRVLNLLLWEKERLIKVA